jgi:pimeloyl-ACP methyl ester carboxylesterase
MHLVTCGSGEPILFIHGMPTNSRLWSGVIDRLCDRYTCFAVDLPGMGKTPRTPYGPDYFRRVAEQVDALRIENGIDKWHVVGHDAGAAVAVHYAHYFQEHVHHLALLSPSVFPELRPYFLLEPLRKPILGEVLAPLIHLMFWRIAMHRALGGKKDREEILKDFCAPFSGLAGPWQFMRAMRWGKPAKLLADVPAFLPQLLMPTLILHGSRDAAIDEAFARRAYSLIPNSSMLTLDSGHFIPLHKPEAVAAWLTRFFGDHPARSAGWASA